MITRINRLPNASAFLKASELIFSLIPAATDAPAGLSASDLLFFDIETTGLSPDTSYLYLIGCLYLDGCEVVHTQFFSEGIADEPELIEAYDEILSSHRVLAHFNGQTFDIPYIERKRLRLGLSSPVNIIPVSTSGEEVYLPTAPCGTVLSFDIFKTLRGYKKFLGLNSMSQKSLEVVCGLNREDIYDGGQLIEVYGRYIATKKLEDLRSGSSAALNLPAGCDAASLLQTLLLHNYEDVLGMLEVSRMLTLPAFLKSKKAQSAITDVDCTDNSLIITVTTDLDLFMLGCKSLTCPDGSKISIAALCNGDSREFRVVFTIPVSRFECKLFYPDYKNYFYLLTEDTAIPCSIGEFMDKSLRRKCTAANCYTRHCLDFVPLAVKPSRNDGFSFKIFRPEFKSCFQYADLSELIADRDKLAEYLTGILMSL